MESSSSLFEGLGTIFLECGFGFSRDLQSSVKGNPGAGSSPCPERRLRSKPLQSSRNVIISFLRDLAERTADCIPNSSERHLPYNQNIKVYELFAQSFTEENMDDSGQAAPGYSYFSHVWNAHVPDVKVRKVKAFTKCTDCELLRRDIAATGGDKIVTEPLLRQEKAHLELIFGERADYASRARQAVRYPGRVCSIAIDGADQSSFGLPHFITDTKQTSGESLKVKLVGLLEHGIAQSLHLFTMTSQFDTGANHIIEVMHRWLKAKVTLLGLNLPLKSRCFESTPAQDNVNKASVSIEEQIDTCGQEFMGI